MSQDEAIAQVRSFNRTVTQRVGALREHYLARQRPLGESRVLWEIGEDGRDLRDLRASLDLDSGYLSRVLSALERSGLVAVGPGEQDKRVRTARLTTEGKAERALLDRRSDDLARSFLEPLNARQQAELVAAMETVERLLTAGTVAIKPCDPEHPDARHCLTAYANELAERFDNGFDPGRSIRAEPDDLREPNGILLLAYLHAEPIGCGALRFHGEKPTEVKRMWVAPEARGLGVGRRLLKALEDHARGQGSRVLHLETNRALVQARALYTSAGYTEVAAFNDEPYAHHWFEKVL
ncbi:bifunctional helix-turn-helix transcriptional regulator/GNAT family N-acetyltransferase [Flindersiella endophytica]